MPLKMIVFFFGEARDFVGVKSLIVEVSTDTCSVPSFLHELHLVVGKHLPGKVLLVDDKGLVSLAPGYRIMVNKRLMNSQDIMHFVLRDGDEVGILPPFSGG